MKTSCFGVTLLCALSAAACDKNAKSETTKNATHVVTPKKAPTESSPEKDHRPPQPSGGLAKTDAAPIPVEETRDALPGNDTEGRVLESNGGEEAHKDIPFEEHYVGKHKLGVNRVNDGKRRGPGRIVREANTLVLTARVEKGPYNLSLTGIVKPVSKLEFVLEGTLKGVPNLEWRNEPPKERTTKGAFTFRSTKGRKYWRLYEVDGIDCVCDDNCGNEFCYVDLAF